ncbi:MAG: DUF1294 domain-containing protein [Lachnospiraceae bacterium]|jgi:uncharacterized membrane protein YsdA (DUF1294 family)|nr:DUF1294 domain-containing protein [Lachnospiraceae bacterium]
MAIQQILIVIFALAVNVTAFILFAVDKRRAIRHRWRIRERTLLLAALAGGGAGSLAAMLFLRHKTRKPLFYLTVPVLSLLQLILFLILYIRAGIMPL